MLSNELKSKKIALCITGSISAIKSPEIARELIRHGANVISVMSYESQSLIQPKIMQWATQNNVLTEVTGNIEHIRLTEKGSEKIDLLLIAPATANTLNKIASGISDTIVTLLASSAIGSGIPIVVAPSMHNSLWSNPILKSNLKKIKNMNVTILNPILTEGKAKITSTENIVDIVIHQLNKKDMKGLNVFVTAGPTYEYLDPIRIITNKSTGKMGFALAKEAWRRGAEVTLVSGPTLLSIPSSINYSSITTTQELSDKVKLLLKEKKYDIFLAAAAPSDFRPVNTKDEKISSRATQTISMKFEVTEKVINIIKNIQKDIFLISFKAEYKINNKSIERIKLLMPESGSDIVAINDVSLDGVGFKVDTNQILLLYRDGNITKIPLDSKQKVAKQILNIVMNIIGKKSN